MASLQARHSRSCSLHPWTPVSRLEGCTCKRGPLFHVVVREDGKKSQTAVGRNRREAERALTKIQGEVDEGVYRPQKNIRFDTFADAWVDGLERKETTKDSYRSTIAHAKEAFGQRKVRQIQPGDVVRLNVLMREKKLSASTRAKHLRVLHACLGSAVSHGYAGRNPVNDLPAAEKPRAQKKEAPYFTNDDIPRLFAELPEDIEGIANVYRAICLTALKTGMREGELIALAWADVDLQDEAIHVRHSVTDGHLSDPKNHEKRTVDVTPELVEMLGAWWGACGKPPDGCLVFPGDTGGYVSPTVLLRREFYPAMKRAGVERIGPTGGKRTFHSLRHTFAKRALENGRQITWLSRHLGHSSLKVTTDTYGHWEAAERKREAALMAGVFGV
jgi:integrase